MSYPSPRKLQIRAGMPTLYASSHRILFTELRQMSRSTITQLTIFLSYSSEQVEVARQLYLSLKNSGHEVFFDRASLPPGEEYNLAIATAIRTSDRFIFLISPESIRDGSYARSELQFAESEWPAPAGRVLPVLAAEVDFSDIPSYLKSVTVLRPKGNLVAEVTADVNWQASGISPGETVLGKLSALQAEQAQQTRANRVASLDHQWETERREHSVQMNGRETNLQVEPWMAVFPLVAGVGMSILFSYGSSADFPPVYFKLAPLLIGIVGAIMTWIKSLEYKEKHDEYRRKRRKLMKGNDDPSSGQEDIDKYLRNLR